MTQLAASSLEPGKPLPGGRARWICRVLLAIFGVILTARLWNNTGELLLDFGRELYIAWQISQGKILYQDLDYRFGPLPAYANALWMRLLGPGVQTILIANLLILLLTTFLLYRLLLKMSDRCTAAVATAVFLGVFALSHAVAQAQYNFLTPYNHGSTYGLMFCLAAISFVGRYAQGGRLRDAAGAGFAAGLCFLTKPEMFLACAAAVACGIGAAAVHSRVGIVRAVLATAAALLVPTIAAFLALGRIMPWKTALGGTLGGWQYLAIPGVVQSPFYRWCLGTDQLHLHVVRMLESAGIYAAVGAVLWMLGIALTRRTARYHRPAAVLALIACAVGMSAVLRRFGPWPVDRGLPVAMIFAVIFFGIRLWRSRRDPSPNAAGVMRFSFAMLALVLLAKMFFFARTFQYGFVLAAPAVMVLAMMLIHEVPGWLKARSGSALFFRLGAIGLCAGLVVNRWAVTHAVLAFRHDAVPLALGGSQHVPPSDIAAGPAIQFLRQHTPPSATLAVFPDASGLNYAAGRASSISYTALNPFEVNLTGEGVILATLRKAPPDYIAMVESDESIYGAKSFGKDYGAGIEKWMDENYQVIRIIPSGSAIRECTAHFTASPEMIELLGECTGDGRA